MSRLSTTFAKLAQTGRRALVPFLTAGDPHGIAPPVLMQALVRGGADVIELGFAFSDPMADGPVIQRASERALAHGVTLSQTLDWVQQFRTQDPHTPVVLMGYLNPVVRLGEAAFAERCAACGVDGVLLVDLPPAEAESMRTVLRRAGVDLILLVAPTTTAQRLNDIAKLASGYLYYVSLTGVTGAQWQLDAAFASKLQQLRGLMPVPVAVGFGVKNAATACAVAQHADGVVIGSALVEQMFQAGAAAAANTAETFMRDIRTALDALPALSSPGRAS